MEGQMQHVGQQQGRLAAALGEGLASLEELHATAGALDVKMSQSLANEVRDITTGIILGVRGV